MLYVLAGAGFLVALMLLVRAFLAADPKALAGALKWVGIGLGVALVGFLAFTGRLGAALGLAFFVMPMLMRYRQVWQRIKAARGPTPGRRSGVRTRFLDMELDHDTGAMDGGVVEGPLAGRRLGDLAMADLLDLRGLCRADPQSLAVLEAWLDRERPDWRGGDEETAHENRGEAPRPNPPGGMSREEAYEVLGLARGASEERIREAHRRLMILNHPDRGGSTYLAARINQAKDVLLAD